MGDSGFRVYGSPEGADMLYTVTGLVRSKPARFVVHLVCLPCTIRVIVSRVWHFIQIDGAQNA